MRRVRGVVHGPAAGLTAPQKGGRPALEAALLSCPYSSEWVEGAVLRTSLAASCIVRARRVQGNRGIRLDAYKSIPYVVALDRYARMWMLGNPSAQVL
jgi:hypothetical protein